MTFNFGSQPWKYSPPQGFIGPDHADAANCIFSASKKGSTSRGGKETIQNIDQKMCVIIRFRIEFI